MSDSPLVQLAVDFGLLSLIAVGGAIGSVSRHLLSTLVLRASGSLFPSGTFAVNFLGCVLFGAIVGAADQRFVLTPEKRTEMVGARILSSDQDRETLLGMARRVQ